MSSCVFLYIKKDNLSKKYYVKRVNIIKQRMSMYVLDRNIVGIVKFQLKWIISVYSKTY